MFNKLSLRISLLLSYLFLLLVSFVVLSVAVVLLFSSAPSPPEPTYEQMGAMLPGLRELNIGENSSLLQTRLNDFADERGARILIVRLRDEDERVQVVYDSSDVYKPGDVPRIALDERYSSRRLEQLFQRNVQGDEPSTRIRVIFGQLSDPDGERWLFAGITPETMVERLRSSRPFALPNRLRGTENIALLIAEPRPTASLQAVLTDFSGSLLPPLLQALLVGGVIALLLAFLISRSIAKPLQALAEGASAVAEGDYETQVEESGPQEVRSVAQAFNYMSEEVRSTHQAQRDFMANVSHDLKTPLTSIQGYSQAIMEGVASDTTDTARIIHDEAGRLNRMVVRLTDLARLQAGRLNMKKVRLQLNDIVAGVAERLSIVAQQKHITLHVETLPAPHIMGDGDRLAQVMTNLISNAIKYTQKGGDVWITTQPQNGGVQVTVRDNGIGIVEDELPRIFERFYQVDKARGPARGTGLGLAITQEIVEGHGGKIRVDSAGKDQGTTFSVWLPSA